MQSEEVKYYCMPVFQILHLIQFVEQQNIAYVKNIDTAHFS